MTPTPKQPVNMSRSLALYAMTVGALLTLALMVSNISALALSTYIDIPFRKYICAGLLGLGSLSGVWAMLSHQARATAPWSVHQAKVTLLYTVFVIFCVLGVLTMR